MQGGRRVELDLKGDEALGIFGVYGGGAAAFKRMVFLNKFKNTILLKVQAIYKSPALLKG